MSSFTDVPASAYYAKAVAWAIENGITNGMTETTFAPNATCTRGQSVTFLYRALGKKVESSTSLSISPVLVGRLGANVPSPLPPTMPCSLSSMT